MKRQRGVTLIELIVWMALLAVVTSLAIFIIVVIREMDDTYYAASKKIVRTWNVKASPRVEVDLFEGYINVVQGKAGQISASLTPFAVTEVSQAAADAALDDIAISATQEGDTIRIKTNAPKVVMSQLKAHIALRVPPDANLDLLTGHGYIYIGKSWGGPHGAYSTSSPVALTSVKARDMGDIYTGIEAEILSNPSLPATKLDLESLRGTVVIKGDNVLIRAKAAGGAIEYVGQPAPGTHSFVTGQYAPHADGSWRLQKGIRIILPANCNFEVDAESLSGKVSSEFTINSTATPTPNSLKGAVGIDPGIRFELQSNDGPIEIRRNPSEAVSLDPSAD